MLTALVVLQLIDAWSTHQVIKKGGHEANPLLIWLATNLKRVTNAKWAWLVIAKSIGVVSSWLVCTYGGQAAQTIGLVIYVMIVINNMAALDAMNR